VYAEEDLEIVVPVVKMGFKYKFDRHLKNLGFDGEQYLQENDNIL
jgi:hypothetical protein